jgi:glyoxylase I family protein
LRETDRVHTLGVHHVSINVHDVPAALAFYVDVIGLTPRGDRPDFGFAGAWLDAGTEQVHLIESPPPADLGQHVAFEVDDIDVAVAEVRSHGIEVSDPQRVGSGRQAFLCDPSGNRIELNQPSAA